MRGIVSLAAAMSLPMFIDADKTVPFEHRDLILLLTFAVIFSTLVIQSLTLGPMIRFFGDEVRDVLEHEELVTRMICANAALDALDKINPTPNPTESSSSGDPSPPQDSPELARIKGEYLDRMAHATSEVLDEEGSTKTRGKGTSEDAIRRIAISAQRTALISLRNKGEVSEEVFRRIERDLDLEETLIDES
jgi:CPA1 family monovalent cation:H+ antiporter